MKTEAAYALALEGIAMGATRSEVWDDVTSSYPGLGQGYVREAMKDAFNDALKQGVERDDIDPSWHSGSANSTTLNPERTSASD